MARSSGRVMPFVLGFLLALVLVAGSVWGYLKFGKVPVAVKDTAFPQEKQIAHTALNARIDREIQQPPFAASEDAYEKGAQVYAENCAMCHGVPGQDAAIATDMYPSAPQLWKKHKTGKVVGVSDDAPGETYWKVKNGIRLTGMPEFNDTLSDAEMWDVTLLLKAADQPLPDPVASILKSN